MNAGVRYEPKIGGPNEVFDSNGEVRPHYRCLIEAAGRLGPATLRRRDGRADDLNVAEGVTFLLRPGEERILPVDWIPRLIPADHWARIDRGLVQRVRALNAWLEDLYAGRQTIVPDEIVKTSHYYYPACEGIRVPHGIHIHVYGPDLVHMGDGRYVILEDNTRIPSGVSYAIKYREITKRLFGEYFDGYRVRRLGGYPTRLRAALERLAPSADRSPVVVLLTEGTYNAAYYDHKRLAEWMGVPLVEPSDLDVDPDGRVMMSTPAGRVRVDVIYRRIQDLDLFVPGLSVAVRKGTVALANAWGTGVVDDKGVFPFTPEMIRRYLGEEPILEIAPTYSLLDAKVRKHVLSQLDRMVVKCREGYGGHEILIGPEAPKALIEEFRRKIVADPVRFIAQDCLDFSTHVLAEFGGDSLRLVETYVDIRTYVVSGETPWVLPGGITRVAQPGTRIVNSSSGGMIKDTWVLGATVQRTGARARAHGGAGARPGSDEAGRRPAEDTEE